MLTQQLLQHGQKLRIGQIGGGDVDIDVKLLVLAQKIAKLPNHHSQHYTREFADKAQLLGSRYENIGPDVLAVFIVQRASASAPGFFRSSHPQSAGRRQ